MLLVEDPDAEEEDARGGARVAFQVMPTAAVEPAPAPAWQSYAAAVLFLFSAATCLQLGLAANVSLLPKARSAPTAACALYGRLQYNCWRSAASTVYRIAG